MTTTTSGGDLVLKTDVLGRVKTPAVRRQSLLEEFERSGLSGAKFAALAGIKYSTFASWLQKRRQGGRKGVKKVSVNDIGIIVGVMRRRSVGESVLTIDVAC